MRELVLILSAGIFFASCVQRREPAPEPLRSIRWAIAKLPSRADWRSCDASCRAIAPLVMEGLTRPDPSSPENVARAAAEKWEWRSRRRLRITLRRDGRWADGSPVIASDFAVAWQSGLTARSADSFARLFCADNASATPVRVKTDGDWVIEVDFPRPCPQFLQAAALPELFPRAKVGRFPQATNGPYRVADWIAGRTLVLVRHAGFSGRKSWPDRIAIHADSDPSRRLARFGSGEADFVDGLTWRDLPDWVSFDDRLIPYEEPKVVVLALPVEARGGLPIAWRKILATSADPERIVRQLRWPYRPVRDLSSLLTERASQTWWASLPGLASVGSFFAYPSLRLPGRMAETQIHFHSTIPDGRATAEALAAQWADVAGAHVSAAGTFSAPVEVVEITWDRSRPETLLQETARLADRLTPGGGHWLTQAALLGSQAQSLSAAEDRLGATLAVLRPLYQRVSLALGNLQGPRPKRTPEGGWEFPN